MVILKHPCHFLAANAEDNAPQSQRATAHQAAVTLQARVATLRGACQLHVLQGRPQAALQLLYQTLPVVSAGTAEGVPQLILTVLAGVLCSEVSLTELNLVKHVR